MQGVSAVQAEDCILAKIQKIEIAQSRKPKAEQEKLEEADEQMEAECSGIGGMNLKNPETEVKAEKPREPEERRFLLEIEQKSIKPIGKTIGSVCQLAQYRDWVVVVKEFRSRSGLTDEKLKREVLHEAKVIANLGDHEGLPFLFGVQTKKAPYGIVLQFLGTKEQSLTLWHAVFKKKLNIDQ